jgi:hypothetical protein
MQAKGHGSESIREGDLILVHTDNKPGFFARVEEITPDVKRGWWRVRFLPIGFENLDFNTLVWILDNDQIRGADYTMSGVPMRIERIPPYQNPGPAPSDDKPEKPGKVVSLADRRKSEER